MLESFGRVFDSSRSMICNTLYNDPSFEPTITSAVIRIACLATSVFIVYQALNFILSDSEKYERIYNNISNASTSKVLFMVFWVSVSLLTGYERL